ncbi:hypothetical protein KGM48_03735 [Patescibacteria group bacterium]|nr:hypothetical protein [Patescibacteria group bacterium]
MAQSDIVKMLVQSGWTALDAQEALIQVTAARAGKSVIGQVPIAMQTTVSTPITRATVTAAARPLQNSPPPPSLASRVGKWLVVIGGILIIIVVDLYAAYYYDIISFPIVLPFTPPFEISGVLTGPAATQPQASAPIVPTGATTTPIASSTSLSTASSTPPVPIAQVTPSGLPTTTATMVKAIATSTPKKR